MTVRPLVGLPERYLPNLPFYLTADHHRQWPIDMEPGHNLPDVVEAHRLAGRLTPLTEVRR